MKQISVNENCSGCGLCIVNCQYLQENAEGNAEPVPGKSVQDKDMDDVKKIINECPESALQIIETESTNKRGTAGVAEIIDILRNKCNSFRVEKISNSDVKLNSEDYYIDIPSSSNEYLTTYTSERAARAAAKDEFNRLCYSPTAYRPILKKVFVEYKIKVLKPYYICTNTEDSAYYYYNQQIRKLLSDAYAEICELINESNNIPEYWKDFSVYLKDDDWAIKQLKNFDERSTNCGIIGYLKDRGEYTSLNWYVDRLKYDYCESYVGEGLFGNLKFKNMWSFSGFYEEVQEFVNDLKDAIDGRSSYVEDEAVNCVNYALETFEKKVKEEFSEKISELEEYVGYKK